MISEFSLPRIFRSMCTVLLLFNNSRNLKMKTHTAICIVTYFHTSIKLYYPVDRETKPPKLQSAVCEKPLSSGVCSKFSHRPMQLNSTTYNTMVDQHF